MASHSPHITAYPNALANTRVAYYEANMAQTASIFAPSPDALTIALLVLPQASILEVASTLDPLRSANRHLGQDAYRWRVVSPDGNPIPLTCGFELPSSGSLRTAKADTLIVIAGYRQSEVATAPLIRDLSRMAPRFKAIGGIDAGGWVLARAGLLNGHKATVHWEDHEDFATAHPEIDVHPSRYVIDRKRFTAGGAAPAADLMLHLIRSRHGPSLALAVAASFITTAQDGAAPQITPPSDPRLDPRVAAAIAGMEANLDAPEPTAKIAASLNLSPRRLETLFHQNLHQPPGAYALQLRLAAARRLITDTRHPLAEVALRTGFTSASTLSRAFQRHFGTAPSTLRRI